MEHETEHPEDEDKGEPGPTNLPVPDGTITATGYVLSILFHPDIRLHKKRGHEFALKLSDYLDLEKSEFQSHKWSLFEPSSSQADSGLYITVTPNTLKLHVRYPSGGQERVETRFASILNQFGDIFKPNLVLQSGAVVRGHLVIDGDARTYLASHLMHLEGNRIDPFGRPIHMLGMKFYFPPLQEKGPDGHIRVTNWGLNLRAESLMEDPKRLFLEADATWVEPVPWGEDVVTSLVEHLGTVKTYLEENVLQFLRPSTEDDETGE